MNVFDILGPVMIGPSSSHTAGAARIGQIAQKILDEPIVAAEIYLHGSFAETYKGHGTDRAIVGGLLGFPVSDERLKEALAIADSMGIKVKFEKADLGDEHPNTAKIVAHGVSGKEISLVASSIGGGNIKVTNLLGYSLEFNALYNTLIILHIDMPGTIESVAKVLANKGINIAYMKVTREYPGQKAMMLIETDDCCDIETVEVLKILNNVLSVTSIKPSVGSEG